MKLPFLSAPARRGAVICGAYGLGNAGDDAVLRAILEALRGLDPDMPVTVMARRPKETARRFGAEAVHPMRPLRWLRAMGRARLFISGGGTLLQDVTSRRSLFYYLTSIRAAKKMGCAVQLYGCGVGPLRRERSRTRTAAVLNACADVVTVRDADSAALLKDIGVDAPPVLLAADPALSLPPAGGEREKAAGFALRPWRGFSDRGEDIAACARYIYETYRLPPVFFCFAPEDRAAARALCAALPDIPCAVSADLRRFGRMSLAVSMRLHGLIFALRDGVPAMGISYDPKVEAFCREAALPCVPLAEADADTLRRLADEAAHLDGEDMHAAAVYFRSRERVSAGAAAQLLIADGVET